MTEEDTPTTTNATRSTCPMASVRQQLRSTLARGLGERKMDSKTAERPAPPWEAASAFAGDAGNADTKQIQILDKK